MNGIPKQFQEQYQSLIINVDKLEEFKKDKTIDIKDTNEFFENLNRLTLSAEVQKQEFKKKILQLVSILTCIQLVFFNLIVAFVIVAFTTKISWIKSLKVDAIVAILDFLKYYIGATVVELLGMLLFIIGYVFSDSKLKKKIENKKEK